MIRIKAASPLAMAEWIEITPEKGPMKDDESPLAMKEWIEISSTTGINPFIICLS